MKRVMAAVFLLAANLVAAEPRDYASFLRELVDLDRLPFLEEGVKTALASSYDRASKYDPATDTYAEWGANNDSGQYLRIDPKTGEGVMAEIAGPGCIYRIWSANPQGKIRFYFDGARQPLEFDFEKLFGGDQFPFVRPFVWQRRVAFPPDPNPVGTCYLPIPFAKSCKVTADQPYNQYYHIGYKTFPKGTPIPTFRLQWSEEEKRVLGNVALAWDQRGKDPQPRTGAKEVEKTVELAPHQEQTLVQLEGPATIQQLRARLDSSEKFIGRKVLLKIFWDEIPQPSVDAPMGDFFGADFQGKPYRSLPLGHTEEGGYCYWRMPFAKSARIVAVNDGEQPVKVSLILSYWAGQISERAGYFHAKWRRERTCTTFDYPILEASGNGKFVGAALFVDNVHGGWWGEGDDKVWVDGEIFPSTHGTNTDGYFGDGGGLHDFENALHGCRNSGRAQMAYRWHIGDSIAFSRSFRFTLENYEWLSSVKNDYSSIAYWYAKPSLSPAGKPAELARDFFTPMAVADRMPLPPHIEMDVQEAEQIAETGAKIVEDETLSWGKGVLLSGSLGKSVRLTVNAPRPDRYAFEIGTGPKTDRSAFEVFLGRQMVGDRLVLQQGPNEMTVRLSRSVPPETPVVLDYVRIGPWRNFVRDWLVVGPFDNTGDRKFDEVYPPEKELVFRKIYEGKSGIPCAWQTVRTGMDGRVNFNDVFPQLHEETIAYAVATVVSPNERFAEILLGSDGGVKVWLNGQLVHSNHTHRSLVPDEDRVWLRFRAGRNTLMVKIDQGSGGWGFCLRVNDSEEDFQFGLPK